MNTRFLKTLAVRSALLAGSLGALTTAAHAQAPLTKATVPFEFAAGGTMMPAGDYTIEVPDISGVILLRGSQSNVALITTFSGATSTGTSVKLVFERRDGMAYLSGVQWPDQTALVMSAFRPPVKAAFTAALH